MKVQYRGYDLEARREDSMSGDEHIFWNIYRVSDGYCGDESYVYPADETVHEVIRWMKERVDTELASDDPWEERASQRPTPWRPNYSPDTTFRQGVSDLT